MTELLISSNEWVVPVVAKMLMNTLHNPKEMMECYWANTEDADVIKEVNYARLLALINYWVLLICINILVACT